MWSKLFSMIGCGHLQGICDSSVVTYNLVLICANQSTATHPETRFRCNYTIIYMMNLPSMIIWCTTAWYSIHGHLCGRTKSSMKAH